MITVKYIKNFTEDSEQIIESKEFPNVKNRWDKEIEKYTYSKLLELDQKYNFYDYENAPLIEEIIYDGDKILSCSSCVELYYNL